MLRRYKVSSWLRSLSFRPTFELKKRARRVSVPSLTSFVLPTPPLRQPHPTSPPLPPPSHHLLGPSVHPLEISNLPFSHLNLDPLRPRLRLHLPPCTRLPPLPTRHHPRSETLRRYSNPSLPRTSLQPLRRRIAALRRCAARSEFGRWNCDWSGRKKWDGPERHLAVVGDCAGSGDEYLVAVGRGSEYGWDELRALCVEDHHDGSRSVSFETRLFFSSFDLSFSTNPSLTCFPF